MSHCIHQALFKGYNIWNEPFLNQVRESTELTNLIMLKNKNKILLANSATLMGILDPYGILEEGEIFVQFKRDVNNYEGYKNKKFFKMFQKYNKMN